MEGKEMDNQKFRKNSSVLDIQEPNLASAMPSLLNQQTIS